MGTAPGSARSPLYELEENIAGLLCWLPLGPIPILASAFFLMTRPYKSSKFIRFHATQSIFAVVALLAVMIAFLIVSSVLTVIFPPIDLLIKPLMALCLLAAFGVFVYMAFKAYRMETPRLPYISEFMSKYAGE